MAKKVTKKAAPKPGKKRVAEKSLPASKASSKKAPPKKKAAAKTPTARASETEKSKPKARVKASGESRSDLLRAYSESWDYEFPVNEVNDQLAKRFRDLEPARRKAEAVLEQYREQLMKIPGVTGMHVGFKRSNKQVTKELEYCIRIDVTQKWDSDPSNPHPRMIEGIPPEIGDVATDVTQQNYFYLSDPGWIEAFTLASPKPPPTTTHDPILGGIAISKLGFSSNWGTLGMVLFQGSNRVYITNQHVVGSLSAGENRVAHPPSSAPADTIGNILETSSPLDEFIDAAVVDNVVVPKRKSLFSTVLGPSGNLIIQGERKLSTRFDNGGEAFIVGAASGTNFNRGRIKSVDKTVRIGDRWMKNQIVVEPIHPGESLIQPGDSGSVLLQEPQSRKFFVVGLAFAGTLDGCIVANHFSDIRSRFQLTLS